MIGARYTVLPSLVRFYNAQSHHSTRKARVPVRAATTPLGLNFSSAINVDNFQRLGIIKPGDDHISVEDVRVRDVRVGSTSLAQLE
jgi:hypothetical protein